MKYLRRMVFLSMLVLVACAPVTNVTPTSIAVQIPEALNNAIGIGIAALLAMGAAYLFQKIGLDLRGYTAPIAITFSTWVVTELQNIINTIPEQYDPYLDMLFRILVVVVGSVGVLAWRKYSPKPTAPGALPEQVPDRLL